MPLTPPEKEVIESTFDAHMVELVDLLWRLENGIIDDATKHRTIQNAECVHLKLDAIRVVVNDQLGINLVVDSSKQKETYPHGENGDK